jgi:hypothetical protein
MYWQLSSKDDYLASLHYDKIYGNLVPPPKTRDEKWPYRLTASDYENSRPPVGNKAKPSGKTACLGWRRLPPPVLRVGPDWSGVKWRELLSNAWQTWLFDSSLNLLAPSCWRDIYAQIDYPLLLISCIVLPVEVPWSREATMVVFYLGKKGSRPL